MADTRISTINKNLNHEAIIPQIIKSKQEDKRKGTIKYQFLFVVLAIIELIEVIFRSSNNYFFEDSNVPIKESAWFYIPLVSIIIIPTFLFIKN